MDKLSPLGSKAGAMTVPKLVAIILAIVVLLILVFGAGHLNPLYQRVGRMFDSVLSFFGLIGSEEFGDCTMIPIKDYGSDGISFLEKEEVPLEEYDDTFFELCDDGTCGVDFSLGKDYRVRDGEFEYSYTRENWASQEDYLFYTNAELTKEYWEIYHGVLDLVEGQLAQGEFKALYDGQVTGSFELWGDSSGIFDLNQKTAVWKDGSWTVKKNKKNTYGTKGTSEALGKFYSAVTDGRNDDVYYLEGGPILRDQDYMGAAGTPDKLFDESKDYIPYLFQNNVLYVGGQWTNVELDAQDDGSYLLEYGLWNQNIGDIKDGKVTIYKNSNPWSFDSSLRRILPDLVENYTFDGKIFKRTNGADDISMIGGWYPLSYLIESDNYKLDKDSELEELIVEVEKIVERLWNDSMVSEEYFAKLEGIVNGKEIVAGGLTYVLEFQKDSMGRPQIMLVSGDRKYWLSYSNNVETFREVVRLYDSKINLRHYPLKLTHNEFNRNVQPRELDYKLPKSEFPEFYKINVVEDFIEKQCY